MSSQPQWLSRYQNGQRDQVWHELRQLGNSVRDSEWAEEAQAVCDEMARRARHNIELIVERLTNEGYRFHTNDDAQTATMPHAPPTEQAAEHLQWLEERFGPVPMTLSSWVRIVGDVWLVGTHPEWPTSTASDPLVIEVEGSRYPGESIRDYLDDEFTQWQEDPEDAGLFVLPLAPDRLHKDNTSGGAPYGIVLPDGCVDGLFSGEGTTMPFVAYLNWVFSEGGFPWATGAEGEWRTKRRLAADLLPL
ncbi:hypothetical protein ACIA8G_09650 [Lentzea sp. NPDC051213]|uniref:hypothetical protein n=1 Tax=Lentzea sp. NPDC051213 TaxID=3364126 RepID=UPI0037B088D0